MTVSLVYSSISPWMRRNRGIFPLYSCFRIVEYTSSPGRGERGMGKGRQHLKSLPQAWATGLGADHPPAAQGSHSPTIKQNKGVLIRAEGSIASPLTKRLHSAIYLGEVKGVRQPCNLIIAACHRGKLPSQGPHSPGRSIPGEVSLPHLLLWGAEAHPDKSELTKHMGRGLLTRLQQLGRRALVPHTSSPSPCLSRSVM